MVGGARSGGRGRERGGGSGGPWRCEGEGGGSKERGSHGNGDRSPNTASGAGEKLLEQRALGPTHIQPWRTRGKSRTHRKSPQPTMRGWGVGRRKYLFYPLSRICSFILERGKRDGERHSDRQTSLPSVPAGTGDGNCNLVGWNRQPFCLWDHSPTSRVP